MWECKQTRVISKHLPLYKKDDLACIYKIRSADHMIVTDHIIIISNVNETESRADT